MPSICYKVDKNVQFWTQIGQMHDLFVTLWPRRCIFWECSDWCWISALDSLELPIYLVPQPKLMLRICIWISKFVYISDGKTTQRTWISGRLWKTFKSSSVRSAQHKGPAHRPCDSLVVMEEHTFKKLNWCAIWTKHAKWESIDYVYCIVSIIHKII